MSRSHHRGLPACAVSALAALCLTVTPARADTPSRAANVYPGKTWATRTPAEVGLDARQLDAMRDYVGGRGCLVRHGYLAYSWGDVAKRGDVASACKPWFVHFLLLLLERGEIKSLNAAVEAWEPRLHDLNACLGNKDRAITWRHLAYQTSCYGVQEQPGRAYDYSDYNMALLFDTLFLKAYQTSWARVDADLLHPLLTDLLQCEDGPTFMAFGTKNRPGRLAASVRDCARFGLLYLRKGRWQEKQLLDEKLAVMAVTSPLSNAVPRTQGKPAEMIPGQRSIGGGNNQTDHLGSYSFAWWTNGTDRDGRRHWPAAPVDTYAALGHGGKRALVVLPSLDVVISWNDSKIQGRAMEDHALGLLTAAVTGRGK